MNRYPCRRARWIQSTVSVSRRNTTTGELDKCFKSRWRQWSRLESLPLWNPLHSNSAISIQRALLNFILILDKHKTKILELHKEILSQLWNRKKSFILFATSSSLVVTFRSYPYPSFSFIDFPPSSSLCNFLYFPSIFPHFPHFLEKKFIETFCCKNVDFPINLFLFEIQFSQIIHVSSQLRRMKFLWKFIFIESF